jgi:hypothetical protein
VQVKLIAIAAGAVLALVGAGCSDDSDGPGLGPATGGNGPGSGGATGVGGDPGVGGGVVATPVAPTLSGTIFTLQIGDVVFAADSNVGGRIVTFGIGAANLLTGPDLSPNNYGSTFWPAPQSWPWPPPEPVDRSPYTGQVIGNEIVLQGSHDPTTGITVEKRYSADSTGWVTLTFTMTNTSTSPQTWAPWQVTRVAKSGFSLFPTGSGGVGTATGVVTVGSETWFDAGASVEGEKLFADGGGGWFAHATGTSLFVKRFADLPPGAEAPGEAEIEIYSGAGYVELEVQGALATLNVGESSTWTVQWKVVPLAAPVPAVFAGLDTASLASQASQVAGGQ